MFSLFAEQEREAKLDILGDPLTRLDKHVDFAALADRRAPRYSRAYGGRLPHPSLGFRWLHERFSTNWRMMEVQALIGRIKLRRIEAWHAHRLANAERIWECASRHAYPSNPRGPRPGRLQVLCLRRAVAICRDPVLNEITRGAASASLAPSPRSTSRKPST